MYKDVSRSQIAERLAHLRQLFREVKPTSDQGHRAHEKREVVTKNLLSNLSRTKDHPTLHSVLEIAEVFSLTIDGAHRLFGYDLESIRSYDTKLNGGRTHIIESYAYERDLLVDLPSQLGEEDVFRRNATLHDLVSKWQSRVPIRALETLTWRKPGVFYVQVGTEDSLGSSLPPGAIGLVEPITDAESRRPNPRSIYLLQFGNGYRCSRCVVTRGKLILLTSGRRYMGPHEFAYPLNVRIVGKIRLFALRLPIPEYPSLATLPVSAHSAPLVLPWEHPSMDRLFAAKHARFRRSREDLPHVAESLAAIFHRSVSGRTERRYRHPTASQPHVDALIQLSLTHVARYSDALRVGKPRISDRGRYSLDAMLHASHLHDLDRGRPVVSAPIPHDRWMDLRKQFVEWPILLSLRFPRLSVFDDRIIRVPEGNLIQGLDPPLSPGSLVLLEKVLQPPDPENDAQKKGWARPMYALRRSAEFLFGHLERESGGYILLGASQKSPTVTRLQSSDLDDLNCLAGVAVPV